MSPTLGASLGASLSRIVGTLLGLGLGLAAVEAFGQGYDVAGVVAGLVVLLLPALRLEASARLGAATSLLVTIVPGSDVLGTAFARGANVPLGCAVAIVVGAVLWPSRAGPPLPRAPRERRRRRAPHGCGESRRVRGREEARRAAPRARCAGGPDGAPARRRAGAALEPPTGGLGAASSTVDDLAHVALELHAIAREAAGDGARALVAEDASRVAEALLAACERRADGQAGWSGGVYAAVERLRRDVEDDRAARRLLPYPADELVRLLAIVREGTTIARALGELEAQGESALRDS